MKFLLINQYAGNKGDRAVLFAMCKMLKNLYPSCHITVSTSDPALWKGYGFYEKENIKFIPSGWDYKRVTGFSAYWKFLDGLKKYTFTIMRETFLRNINVSQLFVNPVFYHAALDADVILSVGGHHYTTLLSRDLVSAINFDAMAVGNRNKMICFSQSFGPFDFHNQRNKLLTQRLLSNFILMPREKGAEKELTEFLQVKENIFPTFESVLSLSGYIDYNPIPERDKAVGIAIYCTQQREEHIRNSYQNVIADFCNYVIESGYSVRFFPMEIKDSEPDDRNFIKEIIIKTKLPEKCSVYDRDLETLEHLIEVSKCKVFLGHKTHSTIFALATGTPLIALAYHPKTIEFLKQFGLEENVIDDKYLTTERVCEIFDRISQDFDNLSKHEYEESRKIAERIKNDIVNAINIAK